jgi:hypothetical protein
MPSAGSSGVVVLVGCVRDLVAMDLLVLRDRVSIRL